MTCLKCRGEAMSRSALSRRNRIGIAWPLAAAAATVLLWRAPYGQLILWPFSLLATWFHEMGHGLAAALLGGHFDRLLIYPNGSGQAFFTGRVFGGPLGSALVAAGGPLGSSVAGFLLILGSRSFTTARLSLYLLGGLLIVSAVMWTRTVFGFAFTCLMGASLLLAAARAPREVHGFAAQFLGAQACVSVFHELDYIFSTKAVVNGAPMASDTARIADLLGGTYFIWGALMAVAAVGLLGLSLRAVWKSQG